MNIYLEIFGYIGTAFVLLSMMMTTVTMLRYFNICGSVISAIYSAMCSAWPVAVLNMSLIIINTAQLIRSYRTKKVFKYVNAAATEACVMHLLTVYDKKIKLNFSDFCINGIENSVAHIVYEGDAVAALMLTDGKGELLKIRAYLVMPRYSGRVVADFLFSELESSGVVGLYADIPNELRQTALKRLGFTRCRSTLLKHQTN